MPRRCIAGGVSGTRGAMWPPPTSDFGSNFYFFNIDGSRWCSPTRCARLRAPCAPELAHEPAHHQHHASRAPPGPPPPPPDVLRRAERLAGFLASMSPRTTRRTAVAASQPAQRPVLGTPGTAATPSAFPSIIPHSSTHLHPQTPPSSTSAACADPPSPPPPLGGRQRRRTAPQSVEYLL